MNKINHWWSSKSLAQQFAWVSSMVVIPGMLVIGSWVSQEIERTVTRNAATTTALYMDSIVAPHILELNRKDRLSEKSQVALNHLLDESELGKIVTSTKIWKKGGLVAYSSQQSIIGKVFPVTDSLRLAWSGEIQAEFDSLEHEENALDRAESIPFLEIYSPIRDPSTKRVIAIAEFYAQAESLKKDLFRAQLSSWIVVGLVTVSMIGLLSGIVLRGSRTIETQSHSLQERVQQLTNMRDHIESSSRLSTELNERFLRRVGSDLHDGPAQLIGLALLRLDRIKNYSEKDSPIEQQEFEIVRDALNDALTEIRGVSSGLTLPELETRPLEDGLFRIVSMHEQRTDTRVVKDIHTLPEEVNKSIKISLYRMVQEGLNNAFRHSNSGKTSVTALYKDEAIEVTVADQGSGFDMTQPADDSSGLGLPGLRERIESIGGSFVIDTTLGGGTTLTARFVIGNTA
ncbi:MAG: ATP-binding protein [Arenicellales bacterium]